MRGFNKFQDLLVAVGAKNRHDKSSIHVTTNDFYFLKPAFSYEVMGKEDISVKMSTFSRATPMSRPAYVDVDVVNHAFFVPFRTVFPQWDAFYNGTPYGSQLYSEVPLFNVDTFFRWAAEEGNGNIETSGSTKVFFESFTPGSGEDVSSSDLRFKIDGAVHYLHMTRLGKQFVSILQALGYNFPLRFYADSYGSLPDLENDHSFLHNVTALPLLCFMRIWYDYFMPSDKDCSCRYVRSSQSQDFVVRPEIMFVPSTWYPSSGSGGMLNMQFLDQLAFWLTMVPYQKDYYSIISRNPVLSEVDPSSMPLAGYSLDGLTVNDPVASAVTSAAGVPVGASGSSISSWVINAVNSVTKFFMRDKYAGVRAIDRYLSRFGIQLSNEQLQRAVYLGKQQQKVQISAQMNTSPSGDSVLGDYAGKADSLPYDTGNFEYHATEFGQLIIVSQFIPKSPRYQGLKREMLHLKRNDFFQPEYDSLGYQGVPRAEWQHVNPLCAHMPTNYDARALFGWLPRYAEYKVGTDKNMLTGDFRFYSAGAQSYESMQLFRQSNRLAPVTYTERQYFIGTWDASLDRIFVNTDSFYDHFVTYYDFQVTSYQPSRKLFDIFDGVDGEHHERVQREVGGTQL